MICLDVIVRLSDCSFLRINGIRIFEMMERPGKPLILYPMMIRLELKVGLR